MYTVQQAPRVLSNIECIAKELHQNWENKKTYACSWRKIYPIFFYGYYAIKWYICKRKLTKVCTEILESQDLQSSKDITARTITKLAKDYMPKLNPDYNYASQSLLYHQYINELRTKTLVDYHR